MTDNLDTEGLAMVKRLMRKRFNGEMKLQWRDGKIYLVTNYKENLKPNAVAIDSPSNSM